MTQHCFRIHEEIAQIYTVNNRSQPVAYIEWEETMPWIRYLLAFILFMHGLAHLSGLFTAWTKTDLGYSKDPWMFSGNVTLKGVVGKLFGVLWLAAALALSASGFGLAFGGGWWPTTAALGAALSLFAILPWLRSVPPGAWAGAAFDALILLALAEPWNEQVLRYLS